MEIVCNACSKKYVSRACYEKHLGKCGDSDLLKMIRDLTKRVVELEKQLNPEFETPLMTFQEFVNEKKYSIGGVNWDEKASVIYLEAVRNVLKEADCVRMAKKTFVYDEERGWIKMKDVSMACIEVLVRSIQTKLLVSIQQDANYFKNVTKMTIDVKKWTKDNISKI